MIIIRTYRQEVETIAREFFSYINMAKDTRLNNVAYCDRLSEQYIGAMVYNCILTEVEMILKKQLVNTASKKMRIKLNYSQAAIMYRELFLLPIDSDHIYQNQLRNKLIAHLEQGLITMGLYQHDGTLHY